jgi:hypothetical protein
MTARECGLGIQWAGYGEEVLKFPRLQETKSQLGVQGRSALFHEIRSRN